MTDDEIKKLAQGPLSPALTKKLAGPISHALMRGLTRGMTGITHLIRSIRPTFTVIQGGKTDPKKENEP